MSWGELTCKWAYRADQSDCPCKGYCDMSTCNVRCPHYETTDGKKYKAPVAEQPVKAVYPTGLNRAQRRQLDRKRKKGSGL